MKPLGKLESVNIREVWENEAAHFTPWLAELDNLERLGEALDLSLEFVSTEASVGSFSADIVCRDTKANTTVLIENQLERTDHRHLGQIFTYAAGLDAVTMIWVSPQFKEEHRAVIDWLNRITLDDFSFFGVEIEIWRIGNSPPAPKFNIVAQPNDWSRVMRRKRTDGEPSGNQNTSTDLKLQQLAFWEGFQDYLTKEKSPIHCMTPKPNHSMWHTIGRSGLHLVSVITGETKKSASEIRANFYIENDISGERLEALRSLEPELQAATGEKVVFDAKVENQKRSKLFVSRKGDWMKPENQPEIYQWLDTKHRAILKVLKPRLQKI